MSRRALFSLAVTLCLIALLYVATRFSHSDNSMFVFVVAMILCGSYLLSALVIWLRDRTELSQLRKSPATYHTTPAEAQARTSPYFAKTAAIAMLVWSLILAAFFAFPNAEALSAFVGLGMVGGAFLLFSAAWNHALPSSNRRAKYQKIFVGQAMLSIAFAVGHAQERGVESAHVWDVARSITGAALFIPACLIAHRLIMSEHGIDEPSKARRALMFYRIGMWAGPGTGLRALLLFLLTRVIDPTGYCFFLIRYFAKEQLLRSPALYLRSFAHPNAALVVGKIVAPVCARLPVEALVHPKQPDAALHRNASSGVRIRTVRVSDSEWQGWVEKELRSCTAVILDATSAGLGLAWEIELALRVVPNWRIVVLVPVGAAEPLPELATIYYDPKKPSLAARSLDLWVEQVSEQTWPRRPLPTARVPT